MILSPETLVTQHHKASSLYWQMFVGLF